MNDFSSFARRHWYVAGLARDLPHHAQRLLLLGEAVAIGRLPSGEAFALEDRCPHRGVPLSDGRIFASGLSCRYHGWTFNAGGRCVGIPGVADAEQYRGICVPAYTVLERDGLIWIASRPDAPLPQRLRAMGSGRGRLLWHGKWRVPVLDAQVLLLQALHSHLSSAATTDRAAVQASLRVSGDGISIDYPRPAYSRLAPWPFMARETHWRVHVSGLCVAQLEFAYAAGRRAWLTVCFTPETLASTRLFATLHLENRWMPFWFARPLLAPIVDELSAYERQMSETPSRNDAPLTPEREALSEPALMRAYLEEQWRGPERTLPGQTEFGL